jgi:predicted dehydrogenase/acetyltransferase-like isoleucine patch superfamily enzyme
MSGLANLGGVRPRLALVGCGYWGRNLLRNFHLLGAVAAICDVDPLRASQELENYDLPALTFDDVLASPNIDAVVLATPAETHAKLALRVLDAGKHAFIEKPLALNVGDATQVLLAAEKRGLIVMVGHLLRYRPAFMVLSDLVAQGRLGRLQYLYSNRLNLGKFRREEDVFWSFAPHDISMMLALTAELPDRISAVGQCYLHNRIADVTTTHLEFGNGINGHIFVSWLHPNKEQKLVVVGDDGMAILDDAQPWDQKLTLYPHRVAWQNGIPEPSRGEPVSVPVPEAEPLRLECEHFLECLRERRQPRTDAHEGIAVLQVLDAARSSMESGRPVILSRRPISGYFVHDSAYVDEGCEIGSGTKIWHFAHILAGCRIGSECVIGQNVMIGPNVTIGSRCKIQNNVSLYEGVELADDVFCGPSCVFTNVINPRAEIARKNEYRRTVVERGGTIGANATIICGHRLGAYCFVAAGAVVTRDVPAHALMVGNPARQVGWMGRAGHRLNEDLVCPQTGERYSPDERGGLIRLNEDKEAA